MRRVEHFHHTPEQVHDAIAQALVLLDEHELTPDERARALPQVLAMLTSKSVTIEQMMPGGIALPGNAGH